MTGTDLAVSEPRITWLSTDQLRYISSTEFVPLGLRGNLPAILACVATGRELGIGDMEALRSIHVIDGKPTFSAELMVKLVRKRGHSISGEITEQAATVTGKRVDNGDEMTVTWTWEMAEQAGLAAKQNWRKYRSAMLWARAVSQLCRMLFADCFAGSTYTTEELGEEFTDRLGEPTEDAAPSEPGGNQPDGVEPGANASSAPSPGPLGAAEDDGLFPPGPEAELALLEARAVSLAGQWEAVTPEAKTAKFVEWVDAVRSGGGLTADDLLGAISTFEKLLAEKAGASEFAGKVPAGARKAKAG